ncbi:MAG: Ger(x)C family spore germination C-terminal domain-containing protein, partial [Oscillospiraceae bacterium]
AKESRGINSVGEISFLEIMSDILSEMRSPYIPIAKAKKNENGQDVYEITGTAIFKGDKFFTEIFAKDSQGLLWTKGKISDNYLIVEDKNNIYAILIGSSNVFWTVEIKNDKPIFNIYIITSGEVQETIGDNRRISDDELTKKIKKLATEEIKKEVKSVINTTAVKNGIDVLDLTPLLMQREPKFWKENQKDFENIIKNATYNVYVSFNIDKIGLELSGKIT